MTNCKYITKNGRCGLKGSYAYRHGCFGEDMCRCREPMTNADRIRAMSDEELAGFLMKLMHNNVQCFGEGMFPYHPCPQEQNCKQCGLDWLQQPVEEDDHDERKENENV